MGQSGTAAAAASGYLTPRALDGLKAYKYSPGGYTFLDKLHNPLWEAATTCLPLWLAPNLITLIGLIHVIVAYLLATILVPDLVSDGSIPRWLHAVCAAAVFMYMHLDCIDGKQARRTRSSSPLGQLFDHGCDALCVFMLMGITQMALGQPCGWMAGAMQYVMMVPWILGHWEEYHSGVMMYGNGLTGVTEANYAIVLICLVSATFGEQVWDLPLNQALPVLPAGAWYTTTTVRHVGFVISCAGSVPVIASQLWRVLGTNRKHIAEGERGHKQLGFHYCVAHLIIVLGLSSVGALWLGMQSSGGAWPVGQCRLASSSFGIVYALVATQLIISHMAKEPFVPYVWPFIVALLGVVSTWALAAPATGSPRTGLQASLAGPDGDPQALFWATCALGAGSFLAYAHYVTVVIQQVTHHLGISCFRINVPKAADGKHA